jgi:Protein of unknown function (DUF998)
VLCVLFVAWGLSTWALAIAVWPEATGTSGRIGLAFLIAAGAGEAMASLCDINHPFHNVAGAVGVLSLPIAALLVSFRLAGSPAWTARKWFLLGMANLPWICLVLMFAALFLMIRGFRLFGHRIIFVGWANRLMVVVYCLWVVTVALGILNARRADSDGILG